MREARPLEREVGVRSTMLLGSVERRQPPLGDTLMQGAARSANFDLLSHQDHHEILANLHGSRVRSSRRRYQILFRRVSLDDVRIHRKSWLCLGKDLSGLFWSHVMRDHLLGSFGTDSRPLK